MTFTIWDSESANCLSLVRGTEPTEQMRRDEPDAVLLHTFEASSWNDAHRKRNELMGWGPYRPMLRADGTPYPEDEAPFPEDDLGRLRAQRDRLTEAMRRDVAVFDRIVGRKG